MKKKRKKALTQNVSLDTSFVIRQNFLEGSKIRDLTNLSKEGHTDIFMTDIIYREIIARFKKNFSEILKPPTILAEGITKEQQGIKRLKKELEKKAMILKNFPGFAELFKPLEIDEEKLCIKFNDDFDKWIKDNNVIIISTGKVKIEKIMDDYFNNNPPFHKNEKKNEFPDAFNLAALSEYFEKLKQKTYILTTDHDLLEYKSEFIFPIHNDEMAELSDSIIRASPKTFSKAVKLMDEKFEIEKYLLLRKISDKISEIIRDEMDTQGFIDGLEILHYTEPSIDFIEFDKSSIINIDIEELTAKLECEVSFSYKTSIEIEDYDGAYYDKEDDNWYGVDSKTRNIKGNETIPVTFLIDFDIDKKRVDFEVEEINRGDQFDVFRNFNN